MAPLLLVCSKTCTTNGNVHTAKYAKYAEVKWTRTKQPTNWLYLVQFRQRDSVRLGFAWWTCRVELLQLRAKERKNRGNALSATYYQSTVLNNTSLFGTNIWVWMIASWKYQLASLRFITFWIIVLIVTGQHRKCDPDRMHAVDGTRLWLLLLQSDSFLFFPSFQLAWQCESS